MAAERKQDSDDEERVRPSANDIYESVKRDAADELSRGSVALGFSGLFAGATLGFSGLAAAAATVALPDHHVGRLIGAIFYPIGFIAAIVGRAQLFTENTLYPVTLVLDQRRHLAGLLRLWLVVFVTNVAGAFLFTLLVVDSGAVAHGVLRELQRTGLELSRHNWISSLWSGVIAGWLLALVAWLVEASPAAVAQIALIWAPTFIIGLAGFAHCVSSTAEVLAAVINSKVSVGHFFGWLSAVTLGNVIGGVLIVAVLNYGQVRADEGD